MEHKQAFLQVCRLNHLSLGRSVRLSFRKVYCGKTADWIRMPFGLVSGVGRGMGVLDGGGYRRREGAVLDINVGRPIETNGILCVRSGDAALPKLLWDFMLHDSSVH